MQKLLAVDVGNTDVKRAIISDGVIAELLRDSTQDLERVATEIADSGLPVGLCSVRPGAADIIKAALAERRGALAVEINDRISNPVSGFYSGMGADRIADTAGAWSQMDGKRPVAVIGLGTGTAITAVSPQGQFMGGYTTLGLGPICDYLTKALPALPPIEPRKVSLLNSGQSVYDALSRGTVLAHVGIIEKWVNCLKQELGSDLFVVATGGWSELLASFTPVIDEVDVHLTMKGIWTVASSK